MGPANLYHYRARYRSNYDGDTIRLDIDLGMRVWKNSELMRLHGVNTPEVRGGTDESKAAGWEAQRFVQGRLSSASDILVETIRDTMEKYGRLLVIVWYLPQGSEPNDFVNLNEELIDRGLAEAY